MGTLASASVPPVKIQYLFPLELTGLSFLQSSSSQFSHSAMSDSVTPWTVARQASLSITNSWSLLKLKSIKSVMSSKYLILCHLLLFLRSIFPSIRVFSNDLAFPIRWPKYWSLSIGAKELLSNGLSRIFSGTTVQKHQFFSAQLCL